MSIDYFRLACGVIAGGYAAFRLLPFPPCVERAILNHFRTEPLSKENQDRQTQKANDETEKEERAKSNSGGLTFKCDKETTTSLTASCLTAAAFPVPLSLRAFICICYPDNLLGIDVRHKYAPHQKSLNSTGKILKPLFGVTRWACSISAMIYILKNSESAFFRTY